MTTITINERTASAKKMLEFLKTQPYVKIIDNGLHSENRTQSKQQKIPNVKTKAAITEASNGGLKKYTSVASLMADLKS